MEVPLIGYGVRDRSLRASPTLTENLYPIAHSGKSSNFSLQHTAGLRLFKDLGTGAGRMLHVMDERLYAVSGTRFYEIDSIGNATDHGEVQGTKVIKADNNGTQLIMPLGFSSQVFDSSGNTISALQNGVGNYFASSAVAVVGRRAAYIRDNTSQFFLSNIDDATTFDADDFANAESRPDDNISTHQFKGHLWLFGQRSYEGWYLSSESFPLNPFPNAKFNIGCGASLSLASDESYMAWLSHNGRIYLTQGASPQPISNADIEYEIGQMESIGDAIAYFYTEEAHTFYVIQFPTAGRVFAFDVSTGEWHERTSNGGRHLILNHAYCYGKHFGISYLDGKIYEMTLNETTDGGDARQYTFTLPSIQIEGQSVTQGMIEFVMDSGLAPYLDNTDLELRWTDNGHDWSDWITLNGGSRGGFGVKFKASGLGSFEERFYQVRTTSKGPIRFTKAIIEAGRGQRG
jgi:hypothetical protein